MPFSNNGGVALANLNDAVTIVLTNNPLGQDGGATFTLAPGPAGYSATVAFEKAFTVADFAAGTWTALGTVMRLDTNTLLTGGAFVSGTVPAAGAVANFSLFGLTGFYAVRARLSVVGSGSVAASGVTFPAAPTSNPAVIALLLSNNQSELAATLALSDLMGTDYLSGVGGSF